VNKDKDFDTSKIKFELPELLVKFLEDKNVMSTQDDTRYFVDNVVYKEQNGWFSLITKPTNDPNVNKFIRECLQYRLEQFQEDKIDLDIADIVGLGWTFDVQEDGYYYFYIHDKEFMKDKIIEYRREIDSYMQLAEKVKQSGESTLAWRNLQLAKGWLGKALGFLGETTPYT